MTNILSLPSADRWFLSISTWAPERRLMSLIDSPPIETETKEKISQLELVSFGKGKLRFGRSVD